MIITEAMFLRDVVIVVVVVVVVVVIIVVAVYQKLAKSTIF